MFSDHSQCEEYPHVIGIQGPVSTFKYEFITL